MSEENTESSGKPAKPPAKRAAKRARKTAKSEPRPKESRAAEPHVEEPQADHLDQTASKATPEAEAASPPSTSNPPEHATKRPKRRRGKKGKGGGDAQDRQGTHEGPSQESASESSAPSADDSTREDSKPRGNQPQPARNHPQQSRPPRHDADDLARKAWKIYLAEVSEEGIALINDQDARDIARRCFRMAEVFLDEQARNR